MRGEGDAERNRIFAEVFNRDVEKITRTVLRVLRERISDGEVADVMANLPAAVRELWE